MLIKTMKDVYESAIKILKVHNSESQRLEKNGLNFEYGQGPVGISLETILNEAQDLLIYSLGLNATTKEKSSDDVYEYVYYFNDNDPTGCRIEYDDLYNAFIYIAEDEKAKELFWKAIAKHDEEARNQYNKLYYDSKIGK